ncbi:hypothetical protein [Trujillonella endophytica]|uniref:Uncharacterized protein n=1 Tax=Trujillonella endophytica TaxID=673521 RepID=A0A1H8VRQ6_9ACTN|nr:hypothetical protein [Trujillella endophytica]SEP17628.1 hypothetical protein SAMN05660991_03722 [Trujillella endophytica]
MSDAAERERDPGETDAGETDPYVLNEEVTVVVVTTDDGDRYVLRDTPTHRAEMAALHGPDSEEATQLDESVQLTEDLRSVRLGIGVVSLWDYTGHREGPVEDRRGAR